ncbi:MAG: PTS system mannose/fructose/sorbose family transporter subunit IID [Deltaproteobacteria bacterium]|nr:PTS system mannose/fructose/sorbose family transporter subunit IID [Deltaproteobacteria bacterium]
MSLAPHTLARVFWRCLFLQAAWNPRGMQNLGFAYAIDPALRELYPDPAARQAALARHLGFFNSHPYMAAAIVGGAIHHEERVARGEEAADQPLTYKATLQGPLAAVGDGFFWTALRPAFGAAAALGALVLGWPALVAAVLLYNAVHLWLRFRLLRDGYLHGDEVVLDIRALCLPAWADRVRLTAAVLAGLAAALLVDRSAGGLAGGLLTAGAAVAGFYLLGRKAPLLPLAYAALLAGVAVGLLGGGS